MSMMYWMLGLSALQIRALRATPSLATHLAIERMSVEGQSDEAIAALDAIGPFEQALELQKSWHILHYVFTGQIALSDAPADELMTGEDVGEDVGYGPARLHDIGETREFARFLSALNVQQLQDRANFQEMSRIGVYSIPFGSGSDAEHESGLRAEVGSYFPRLRDYVVRMSERQGGLLTWLS